MGLSAGMDRPGIRFAWFQECENSELVALVTDDPEKARKLGKEYEVATTISYEKYDELLNSGSIDAVYIALPNNLHADFTIRAARAGVHVLRETDGALRRRMREHDTGLQGEWRQTHDRVSVAPGTG